MSDFTIVPGLRIRSFPAVPDLRFLRRLTPFSLRAILSATAAAAAVAAVLTWAQDAYLRKEAKPSAAVSAATEPPARPAQPAPSSTVAETPKRTAPPVASIGNRALYRDLSSAWRPAGGLAILMAPSVWPMVATAPAPQTVPTEVTGVPLPRSQPEMLADIPVQPTKPASNTKAPAAVATAPAAVESAPAGNGFFAMLRQFFTPHDKQAAAAVFAANPRTAIYDISARAVYMPNGETLEAHSGLGEWLDDPSSFQRKSRGVTPPNTYKISLREKLFHGVKALRLTPVDGSKMYGRDGMLAHTYMLGPNGQSNGCVSFKEYEKFLQAYNNGQVDRLIVVPRMTSAMAYAEAN